MNRVSQILSKIKTIGYRNGWKATMKYLLMRKNSIKISYSMTLRGFGQMMRSML